MQVEKTIRLNMLTVLKDDIESGPGIIVFTDGADILAEMPFQRLDADQSGESIYNFIAYDDNPSLRAAVILSGRVSNFYIDGAAPGSAVGTVGGLNSSSDIRFNRRDWTTSGVITLNNLVLKLINGTS